MATPEAQIMVAARPGVSMRAVKAAGDMRRLPITTRLVGLPCGTMIDAPLATATAPRNSAGKLVRAVRLRLSSTGTITTTAASRETAAVRAAEAAQTRA